MKEPWAIPDTWQWTEMGGIARVVGGGTPDTKNGDYFGGKVAWLTPADLSGYSAKRISRGARNLTQAGLENSGAKLMPRDTVLFTSRAPIGYVAIAAEDVCTNQGFKSFVLGQGVLPDFIYYYLQHAKRLVVELASGTTFLEISSKNAARIPVPVAPTREQQRIVDQLEELLTDLDAGMTALERVRVKLEVYRAGVLKAAVEGVLTTTAQPYPTRPIGEAIESIGQGWSPKCERFPSTALDVWGVIKTTAIQPMQYLQEHNKQLPTPLEPRPHLELATGDLLVTRAGPRSRVGVACLVRHTRPHLMLCDKAYRLRCRNDQALPEFLELVLNAPQIVDELDKLKTGISDSGVNLTQQRFAQLVVPLPSLEVQASVVEAVEDQLSVIAHLEADLQTIPKSAQGLRQAILRHAFTGKLMPRDLNDEPASELVKQIGIEREARAREAANAKHASKPKAASSDGRDGRRIRNPAKAG